MKTSIIAATAAALIAGSVATYAANTAPAPGAAPLTPPVAGEKHGGWRPGPADRAALVDARIASLKAGLKLTPDQEKLWPALETALRDVAKDAAARRDEMRQAMRGPQGGPQGGPQAVPPAAPPAGPKAGPQAADQAAPDAIARLRLQAGLMTARAGDLTKIADAAEPLYKTLDDSQKHRLQILLREDMPKGPFMQQHRPGEGPGGQRRG